MLPPCDKRSRLIVANFVGIALVLAAFVAYRSFAGAGRSSFIFVLLATGCILLIDARRRYPPMLLVLAGLAVLMVFNVIGSDRMIARKLLAGEVAAGDVLESYFDTRSDSPITADMKEFDVLASLLSVVPERSGYTYGTQQLRLLIWPIPRSLWPDKPVYTSIVELVDYGNFSFLTITLYGDSYVTIGIVGMFAILLLISVAINSAYKYAARRASSWAVVSYLAAVMYCPILFRDGPVSAGYFLLLGSLAGGLLVAIGGLRRGDVPGLHRRAFALSTIREARV